MERSGNKTVLGDQRWTSSNLLEFFSEMLGCHTGAAHSTGSTNVVYNLSCRSWVLTPARCAELGESFVWCLPWGWTLWWALADLLSGSEGLKVWIFLHRSVWWHIWHSSKTCGPWMRRHELHSWLLGVDVSWQYLQNRSISTFIIRYPCIGDKTNNMQLRPSCNAGKRRP